MPLSQRDISRNIIQLLEVVGTAPSSNSKVYTSCSIIVQTSVRSFWFVETRLVYKLGRRLHRKSSVRKILGILRGLSPRENCNRHFSAKFCQILRTEGVAWSAQRISKAFLSVFYRNRYYFFPVAQLYSRGWLVPVPDPLLLRKPDSAGNRTWDLLICSQELWPLNQRGGHLKYSHTPNECKGRKTGFELYWEVRCNSSSSSALNKLHINNNIRLYYIKSKKVKLSP
jgi:hypothetical protein